MELAKDVEAALTSLAGPEKAASSNQLDELAQATFNKLMTEPMWPSVWEGAPSQFKGTLSYRPGNDDWRWSISRRRKYGWKGRKVAWDHVQHGFEPTEREASNTMHQVVKRYKRELERTVML